MGRKKYVICSFLILCWLLQRMALAAPMDEGSQSIEVLDAGSDIACMTPLLLSPTQVAEKARITIQQLIQNTAGASKEKTAVAVTALQSAFVLPEVERAGKESLLPEQMIRISQGSESGKLLTDELVGLHRLLISIDPRRYQQGMRGKIRAAVLMIPKADMVLAKIATSQLRSVESQIQDVVTRIDGLREQVTSNSAAFSLEIEKLLMAKGQVEQQIEFLTLSVAELKAQIALMDAADPRRDMFETDVLYELEQEIKGMYKMREAFTASIVLYDGIRRVGYRGIRQADRSLRTAVPVIRVAAAAQIGTSDNERLRLAIDALDKSAGAILVASASSAKKEAALSRTQDLGGGVSDVQIDQAFADSYALLAEELAFRKEKLPQIERQVAEYLRNQDKKTNLIESLVERHRLLPQPQPRIEPPDQ